MERAIIPHSGNGDEWRFLFQTALKKVAGFFTHNVENHILISPCVREIDIR
jgi:hypothetical protein